MLQSSLSEFCFLWLNILTNKIPFLLWHTILPCCMVYCTFIIFSGLFSSFRTGHNCVTLSLCTAQHLCVKGPQGATAESQGRYHYFNTVMSVEHCANCCC